jgi:hypothetical protein
MVSKKRTQGVNQRGVGEGQVRLKAVALQGKKALALSPMASFGQQATFADSSLAADKPTALVALRRRLQRLVQNLFFSHPPYQHG